MKRAAMLVLAAALVAIAALRRRVPAYPDWHAWALDQEGDALEPDPYLTSLTRTSEPCPCVDCNSGVVGAKYR